MPPPPPPPPHYRSSYATERDIAMSGYYTSSMNFLFALVHEFACTYMPVQHRLVDKPIAILTRQVVKWVSFNIVWRSTHYFQFPFISLQNFIVVHKVSQ